MRQKIMLARARYRAAFNSLPTVLFLSPEAHTEMCDITRQTGYARECKSVVGGQFCDMTIHLVPTLESGFYVA